MTNRIKVLPVGTTKRISTIAAFNDIRTKKKEPHIVLEILNDYCSSSTLHGISYLGAKGNRPAEKLWWMIMFVLSVTACAFLISKTWTKWKDNPVLISLETKQSPIWHIPFPAITVCPLNKIVQTKYNYTEKYRNINKLSNADFKIFSDLSLVCNDNRFAYDELSISKINFTDESAILSIRKMAPKPFETYALWKNFLLKTTKHLTEQLTKNGICFSFNMLSQNDMFTDQINKKTNYIDHNFPNDGWNIEDGYLPELTMSAYPRRTAKDGATAGLSIGLQTFKKEIDHVCGLPMSGYKVTLHNPADTPKVTEQYVLIPFNKQVTIIVRPELTKTDKNVRSLPPETRKCYFSNEKSLRFFKVYTQNNCRVECEANITQRYCGCVPFYMPRDNKTKICGIGKRNCLDAVESALLAFEGQEKLTTSEFKWFYEDNIEKLEKTHDIFKNCDCLPSCSSLQYTAEISHTDLDLVHLKLQLTNLNDLKEGNLLASQVDIYFKESQFVALQRSELYGQTDFLANCGGLLGLFMGFSLLSLLEIIYFLTIRLWFKYQSRREI